MPPIGRAGAARLFLRRNPWHLQGVNGMASVSRQQAVSAKSDASTADVIAALENQSMTKVLLIEDDSETAEEITAELTDRGFEVEWSANGIEGLDKARSSRPDARIGDRQWSGRDVLPVIETPRKDQV